MTYCHPGVFDRATIVDPSYSHVFTADREEKAKVVFTEGSGMTPDMCCHGLPFDTCSPARRTDAPDAPGRDPVRTAAA